MRKETKFKFNQYLSRLGEIYHVSPQDFSGKVNIEPSKAQVLESQIQQSAGFLQKINLVPVIEQQGQVIGLGIGSTVAGTTDTSSKSREPIDPTALDAIDYYCYQTNFDTAISYAKLDMWAKFNDFQRRIRDAIVRRQALDRIMIGFNGIKREKTSDRRQNAKLQDVNIGWLQKIRNDAKTHVMANITDSQGKVTSSTIRIGEKGDYKNLDALVMDTVERVIDEVYQDDTDLVIICGRSLLADKYFPIVNKAQANSEMLAADVIISQKRLGGLPAIRAPFFPDKSLLITRLDNLSIYYQQDTRRRQIKDTPERDRIENYESVNEAYVVEDYRGVALVENIEILPEPEPEEKRHSGGSGQVNQGGV
ncbi:phage major capsid protein, P2 family (plasmid) [Arsenophonus nasoniae]|uniref:Phage major capsid protein, P2 family n=1 Tax=Arsenophonus nasoniae TaxID=638 RepID=A0A4P7L2L0_9GAMM|nr:phage major capsid protein, P2 family [Arsenophonus nasoniae]QBY46935.1 Phage major capsid protein, P2 family [Arsenophonus nasoniae]WGM08286.1 phage major capsid protein, P2 family [Arsenophonus nasoniae]WGM13140.1 phage major capsid protein, P2 family [Arsenophonus nasoniae]WGM13823.1 phage major capsid protein, P2 family [Arsenophonus nasoniae]WGM17713.1 phage major capsid protein, P2 family [Arsenophonus nasoniae]